MRTTTSSSSSWVSGTVTSSSSAAFSTQRIIDIGDETPRKEPKACQTDAPLYEEDDIEGLRRFVRHPFLTSLELSVTSGKAVLRRQQVTVNIPMDDLRSRMQRWGWEGENCKAPMLVFGDDEQMVAQTHECLVEEGFTSVKNAKSREAIVEALRKTPAHLKAKP